MTLFIVSYAHATMITNLFSDSDKRFILSIVSLVNTNNMSIVQILISIFYG